MSAVGIAGVKLDFLPIPVFEFIIAITLIVGAIYYLLAQRGKLEDTAPIADEVTGEAAIA